MRRVLLRGVVAVGFALCILLQADTKAPADAKAPAGKKRAASESQAAAGTLYRERYRPQFHYTVKKGWINDPCGLVYYAGEYHLFNDHNPLGMPFTQQMSFPCELQLVTGLHCSDASAK